MPENVSIAYRGANYAIGQGPQFYGIWHAAAPQSMPLEWWPLTPEGWTSAWSRFASIEVPGTIVPTTAISAPGSGSSGLAAASVSPLAGATPAAEVTPAAEATPAAGQSSPPAGTPAPSAADGSPDAAAAVPAAAVPAGDEPADDATDPRYGPVVMRPYSPARMPRNALIGVGLLAVGILLGVIGLFPAYNDGASLAAQSASLWPHLIYLASWAGSAVLILLGGGPRRAGVMFGAAVSVVTFGFFLADVGTPIAYGTRYMGAGLTLSVIGWLVCTAGVVLAWAGSGLAVRRRPAGQFGVRQGRLASHEVVPTVVMILAAIGAAVAFAPSWDSFLLQTSSGASQTVRQGNAFANPAPVIAGDVAVMVLLVAVLVIAVLWRPIRLGAALAAGAIVPMLGQVVSATVQVAQPTSPLQFGYSQAQANALGLTITNGLTAMFWVYCAFLGTLLLLGAWMLLTPDAAADRGPFYPGLPYAGQPYAGQPYAGLPYAGQPYAGQPYPGPYAGSPQPGPVYGSSMTVPSEAAPPADGGPSLPPTHPEPQQ